MGKRAKDETIPTAAAVEKYKMLLPLLEALLVECRELSKKKPDGVLNKFKVGMFNRVLKDVKEVLQKDPSIGYLDLLDEEALPQNSDAVLVLGQFEASMKQFKARHYTFDDDEFSWNTAEGRISDSVSED